MRADETSIVCMETMERIETIRDSIVGLKARMRALSKDRKKGVCALWMRAKGPPYWIVCVRGGSGAVNFSTAERIRPPRRKK